MRWLLVALATCGLTALAAPASGQAVSATLPVTCNPNAPGDCTRATPVVNPDGTPVGGTGGSGATSNRIQGASAAGVAPTGDPVLNGAVYSSATTLPTVTVGAQAALQTDMSGNLRVVPTANAFNVTDGLATQYSVLVNASTNDVTTKRPLAVGNMYSDGTTVYYSRGNATGAFSVSKGTSALATGQVSIATTSTLVAAARTGRGKITVSVGAANTCAFGNTGVTTTTGFPLQPVAGATLTLDTSAAVYAACSATTTVSYLEQF